MSSPSTLEQKELNALLARLSLPLKELAPGRIKKKKVIVIAGPTGVGKTKHSLVLGAMLGGEIISADSMQVYRGMDIGTAKVGKEDRLRIRHHLIDIRDLIEKFTVMEFYQEAMRAIRDIVARDLVPIVVGGTGFYLHALIYGPPQGPPSVPEVRSQLEKEMEESGTEALYDRLCQMDPEYAKTITSSDRHKIIRALEIITLTTKKVSDFPKTKKEETAFDFRCWFLYMPKEELYPLIEMRCDEMIAAGLIEEVKELEKQGLLQNSSASQSIGYRQCLEFLKSPGTPEDFDKFVASFKRASRRYAKRQFTWFKKEPLFRWLNVHQMPIEKSCELIIKDYQLSL